MPRPPSFPQQYLVDHGLVPLFATILLFGLSGCSAPIQERRIPLDSGVTSGDLKNYRLGPGDIVRVLVFQEEDMASEQRIGQDGTINFPLVGRVKIGGQTVEQAGDSIAARLKGDYLVNPQVTVSIMEYSPRRFTIFGQVNAAGSYEIPSEERVTLPTAVAMAGGDTRIGNLRGVTVTRTDAAGITEYKVNLLTPEGRQFLVRDQDLITVPESLF